MTLRLTAHLPGEAAPRTFHLAGRDALVGRDDGCDVVLEHATVSSRHGLLRAGAGGWTWTDLGSRNGSALLRAGQPAPRTLADGEVTPIGPGDALLLGDAAAPVRLLLEAAPSAFAAPPRPLDGALAAPRTVVAAQPIVDLFVAPPDALAALAAAAVAAESPEDLAEAALAYLTALLPRAQGRAVLVTGAGLYATAGDPAPAGLGEAAADRDEVVLLEDGAGDLPLTRSVASAGIRAAVVAPLRATGGAFGHALAWSELGRAALPAAALEPLAVACSLMGLAAGSLAVRAAGEAERARLAEAPGGPAPGRGVVEPLGAAPPFVEAVSLCRAVATADVPVLMLGETGTGKEVLARALHRWSRRAAGPFVAFNCAAVPDTLIESELFGHVRGAFTGASGDRRGLFEEASGGTIFLDEIGEMPLPMQAKLLRVLQEGEVRRVGESRTRAVDVRVVSATHRDLPTLTADGRFRQDLMYRLNAVTVSIPPLRQRKGDLPLLAHHLLGRAATALGKRIPGLTREALAALVAHDFPGNIRELDNELLRAVALTPAGSAIRLEALSPAVAGAAASPMAAAGASEAAAVGRMTLKETVEAVERATLQAALARHDGNLAAAARELGLTRPGFYKVMERLGLTR
jgi:Nif-specific regulatory protein